MLPMYSAHEIVGGQMEKRANCLTADFESDHTRCVA